MIARLQLRDVAWDAARRLLQSWIDGVQALASNGATLRETMAGEVRTATFNSDAPPTVTTKLAKAPAAVLCLLAESASVTVSGFPVSWTWAPTSKGGAVVINALVGASASTDYDITLWLSEG